MNSNDSLVELRAWRDAFARSHDYNVHAVAQELRKQDSEGGRTLIHGTPRRPVTTKTLNKALPPTGPAAPVPHGTEIPRDAPAAEL